MNASDLADRGLKSGDKVDLATVFAEGETPVEGAVLKQSTAVAYDLPKGSAGAYYPEANVLIPLGHHDARSGTPAYKSVPVTVARAAAVV